MLLYMKNKLEFSWQLLIKKFLNKKINKTCLVTALGSKMIFHIYELIWR